MFVCNGLKEQHAETHGRLGLVIPEGTDNYGMILQTRTDGVWETTE